MKGSTKALALYFCESSLYGSTFSLVCCHVKKNDKNKNTCLQIACPSGKMWFCWQISKTKNHIVFDANLTQLNQMTKSYNWIFSSFLKQSKFWKSPEKLIFIHSFVVVVDKVCWNYMFLGNILEHTNPVYCYISFPCVWCAAQFIDFVSCKQEFIFDIYIVWKCWNGNNSMLVWFCRVVLLLLTSVWVTGGTQTKCLVMLPYVLKTSSHRPAI